MTSLTNASSAFLRLTLGRRSTGDMPLVPVRGHVNPVFARPLRMQDSHVNLPSAVSHGTSIALLMMDWHIPHCRCSGTDVAVVIFQKQWDPLNRQGGNEGRPLLFRLLGCRLIDVEIELR
jgi:hypothetical protein